MECEYKRTGHIKSSKRITSSFLCLWFTHRKPNRSRHYIFY